MAASATQTSPGVYTVTVNGLTIPNVAANNLGAYGLSPSSLGSAAASTNIVNGTPQPLQQGSIAYGAVNVSPKTAPPIPDSLYQTTRTAIQNGSMTPQQAQQYLQSYVANGTYSGSVNTGVLFAPMQITQNGLQYNLGSDGTWQSASASVKGNTGNTTGSSIAAATGGVQYGSTGNSQLDSILQGVAGVANNLISTGYTIPQDLQITPSLVSDFLNYAHQVVDPYTQQQISSTIADVNANLQNLGTQYGNNMGQLIQDFGMNLASEQNTAAQSGTAFSGLRGVTENNLVNSTNRSLSSLGAQSSYDMGNAARTAAAAVGSQNAGGITLPTLSTGTVSTSGGSFGSSGTGSGLSYNYNPSLYTVGSIPSTGATNVANQEASYLSQYGTLAGAQSSSGRSPSDLIGMMSGLPANYQLPTNLS